MHQITPIPEAIERYIQHIKTNDPYPEGDPRAMSLQFLRTFIPVITCCACPGRNDFDISLKGVAQWLDTRTAKLATFLLCNTDFKAGRDYRFEATGSRKTSTSEHIMLSCDCFKQLAMMFSSKYQAQVHTYFDVTSQLFLQALAAARKEGTSRPQCK